MKEIEVQRECSFYCSRKLLLLVTIIFINLMIIHFYQYSLL